MMSPLQEDLWQKIEDIITSELERKKIQHELYKERDRIKRQKKERVVQGSLEGLAPRGMGQEVHGGEARRHEEAKIAGGGIVTDANVIAGEADKYYRALCTIVDPEEALV